MATNMRNFASYHGGITTFVKILVIVSCGATVVDCYDNGAPSKSCTSMLPGHGYQQSGSSPYTVEILGGVTSYTPGGQQIQVKVSGTADFSGLLLQARNVGGGTPLGTFTSPDPSTNTKLRQCSASGDSVSHSSPANKNNLIFTWSPPSSATGELEFVATVLQTKYVWWTELRSGGIAKAAVPAVQKTTVTYLTTANDKHMDMTTTPELVATDMSANITNTSRSNQVSTPTSRPGGGDSSAGSIPSFTAVLVTMCFYIALLRTLPSNMIVLL